MFVDVLESEDVEPQAILNVEVIKINPPVSSYFHVN